MELSVIKKQNIISSAIDLISEHGIQAVSTRQVAERQGISHAAIFQYFPKKSDLLHAVLQQYSQYDPDIYLSALKGKDKPKEAFLKYIEAYLTYYENYPAILSVAQAFDVLGNDPVLGDQVRTIFKNRADYMHKLIEGLQTAGLIRKDTDCASLSGVMASAIRGICLKWRLEDQGFPLRKTALQAVNMLLDAFSTENTNGA